MIDMYKDVSDFMKKFNIHYDGIARQLPDDVENFRIKFMEEELSEYKLACYDGDLEGQFDALIDLVYVVLGTAIFQGFPWYQGWHEVHKCNMNKSSPSIEDEVRHPKDIIKPPGWVGPDLTSIIIQSIKDRAKFITDEAD